MTWGVVASQSVILADIARALNEKASDGTPRRLIHTEKRLSHHLNGHQIDDDLIQVRQLKIAGELCEQYEPADLVVAVDLSDIAKPYARPDRPKGMQYACRMHDGSAGKTSMGYPYAELHVSAPDGANWPLLYSLFSFQEPAQQSRSTNGVFLEKIGIARHYVPKEAWWTFDRGYDSSGFFAGLDEMALKYIIRLKANRTDKMARKVITTKGDVVPLHQLVSKVMAGTRAKMTVKKGLHRKRPQQMLVGHCPMWIRSAARNPGTARRTGPERTLVVASHGGPKPIVLLVSRKITGQADVVRIVRAYLRRWTAEEANRRMKDQHGFGLRLEDMRALKILGLRRLLTIAVTVYLFLATLSANAPKLVAKLVRGVMTFGRPPKDHLYRLIRAVSGSLRRTPHRFRCDWLAGT